MAQSYKQKYELKEPYDVIIIGSGMGSMTAAALLSKEGKKVLVLERHYTPGGFTHVFKRRGYEWDVGIHYIGEVGKENSFTRKLFDYIADGNIQWADMGEVYDRAVFGEDTYDFVKGADNLKDKFISYFPNESSTINKYFDLIKESTKASRSYFMDKALPPIISRVAGGFLRFKFLKLAGRTTLDVLSELTDNQRLINVLTTQYGDYGLPPGKSSFAMHAMVVRHYFSGGYFPVGGSSTIFDNIEIVIAENGGAVLTNAEVESVLIEKNKAVGVKMVDGKEFRAGKIVSGTGIVNTYKKLLGADAVVKNRLDNQLKQVSPSVAHIALYVGLNGTPQELKLPKANYWVYPSKGSHDENVAKYIKNIQEQFPVVYISFPSSKDPDWGNRYPGKSTIDIISLVPYEIFQKWEDTQWHKRGEEYEKLKEEFSLRLLEELFKLEPHLRNKIDCYELSTPLSTRNFINYSKGEIYGIDHSPKRFGLKFLRAHTPIKNFFLTGQDIVSAGIAGAMASGLITASAIEGKPLAKRIVNK